MARIVRLVISSVRLMHEQSTPNSLPLSRSNLCKEWSNLLRKATKTEKHPTSGEIYSFNRRKPENIQQAEQGHDTTSKIKKCSPDLAQQSTPILILNLNANSALQWQLTRSEKPKRETN